MTREVYCTAGGYTRREVARQRAELARDIESTARLIETNPTWAGETLPGWYAERAARFAHYVIADLRRPPGRRDHSARYYASMAEGRPVTPGPPFASGIARPARNFRPQS